MPGDATPLYPSFGDSTTAYAPPPGSTRSEREAQIWVREFYTVWTQFSTAKRFEWVGKWDVERGEDRSIRRLMEKGNKKVRDEYRKEYNDTVRVRTFAMVVAENSNLRYLFSIAIPDSRCFKRRRSANEPKTKH